MQKLEGRTFNVVQDNIAKLKELFPEVLTENKIDIEKLLLALGEQVENEKERYEFTWNGKKEAIQLAQKQTTGTLRPCKEESKDWDSTQNLYIEGDNLEVLRILQSSYRNKVKMIYIDPPYNTGKDFVYKDNFKDNLANYKAKMDESYKSNSETNGRFHTEWLNMMYPRLKLARNLLNENGLIFISIGDNEVANLKLICNEIFGEENLLAQLIWNTEGNTDNQLEIKIKHEYILLYAKDASKKDESIAYVLDPNTREDSNLHKGFADNNITKNNPANPPKVITLPKGFPSDVEEIFFPKDNIDDEFFKITKEEKMVSKKIIEKYNLAGLPIKVDQMDIKDHKLQNECKIYGGFANSEKLQKFIANKLDPIDDDGEKLYFYINRNGCVRYRKERIVARNILSVLNNLGTTERMKSELRRMGINFDYPKPVDLIKYLVKIGTTEDNDIVLDFFAGSGTLAHSIISLNSEESIKRRYIMVQLPEKLSEKSAAYKDGFRTISQLCKERILRSGQRIIEEKKDVNDGDLDIGFKLFKLDDTNLKAWEGESQDLEMNLINLIDPLKDDRTQEDVIYEILLKYGVDITVQIEETKIADKTVYSVGMGYLLICLERDLTLEHIEEMAKKQPTRIVFYDEGFKNDTVRTNAQQILKRYGVEDIRVI